VNIEPAGGAEPPLEGAGDAAIRRVAWGDYGRRPGWTGFYAPAGGLLGRGVGKPGRLPLGRDELPEVMAASAVRVGLDGAREPVKQIVNIADEHGEL